MIKFALLVSLIFSLNFNLAYANAKGSHRTPHTGTWKRP